MPSILKHDRKRYKPAQVVDEEVEGDGFIDSVGNLISNLSKAASDNKDLIASGAKAVGSVAGAASKIADTVKRKNEADQLQIVINARNKRLEREALGNPVMKAANPETPVLTAPIPPKRRGDGFKILTGKPKLLG